MVCPGKSYRLAQSQLVNFRKSPKATVCTASSISHCALPIADTNGFDCRADAEV